MIAAPLAECQEVGWLLVDDDDKVVVMRSWNQDGQQGGACIAIPQSWVLRCEKLVPIDDVAELLEEGEVIDAEWDIE